MSTLLKSSSYCRHCLYCPTSPECLRWRYLTSYFFQTTVSTVADHAQNIVRSCAACANTPRSKIAPCSRPVWREVTDGLPNCRRRRLLYAASAWWDFTTAVDRQRIEGQRRIEGFLRRGVRAGYRCADEPTAAQLVEDSDDQLFHRVQYDNYCHVLQPLFSNRRTYCQGRRHGFESEGTNSASEARKFFWPPLFGQRGTKYCLDIAKSA